MANDVAVQRAVAALSQNRDDFEGLETFSARDLGIQPTSLRIMQRKKRGQRGDVGDLILGAEEPQESVQVILLRGLNQRFLYEGPQGSRRLTCMSGDGALPLPEIEHPKSHACIECDYGKWTDHATEKKDGKPKRIPPICSPAVVFLGLRPAMGELPLVPFWFVCTKTAFDPAKRFSAEIRQSAQQRGIKSFRQLLVKISTNEEHNQQGGQYYTPIFTVMETHPEWLEEYRPFFLATEGVIYAPDVAATAAAETDDGAEDGDEERAARAKPVQASASDDIPF